MNQCDEKQRSPTPKHAATAGIWRHEREGISYPLFANLPRVRIPLMVTGVSDRS